MAGHSKWKNIQRRKNAQDAKRGKIFMTHAKNIYLAAKDGGGDPDTNATLRTMIDKAKADNMPNDNIERAIKKATGSLDGASYEEITYEGYGPGGTAVIVHALTDNKNRTAAEVRHAFKKNGGNLGENGCVSFMFDRKGYIVIEDEENKIDEDELTLEAIEAGASDFEAHEGAYEIYTEPEAFNEVVSNLENAGYEFAQAEITLIPQTYTKLDEENFEKMQNMLAALENDEDVQDIHHNMENEEA
ncbi:YebC/PmpR family DNA-binding transcriptional regulator [Aciduricibacillus chroicocephali]|uniref:Probable transcriptional regulatory protein QR721_08430 n=1 Tax=Aciduricibacillus chroicocephali TaxID=3054939 RepID=A0ABY9KTS4_9BACI|nr:YebC/PmpR family DNA-binding transcriptional regulator [Bacillaceae bacterium 44XB]